VSREALVLGVAGVFFGFLMGWIIRDQRDVPGVGRPAAIAEAPAAGQATPQAQTAAPLDESRAAALKTTAERNPADAETRVLLGNLYFDAERYPEAAQWYEAALKVNPRNPNVSTDLGIAYYYMNQPDRALAQFARSLEIDPRHTKTLLNLGIVRAFGKQDLAGASKAWEQVIEVAPGTPEADMARQALDGMKSAHPETNGTPAGVKPPRE
jgi:cytochrome c-type biogenesis protein CcmH/NrfG